MKPLLGNRFEVISTLGFVVVTQQALAAMVEKTGGTEIADSPSCFGAASNRQPEICATKIPITAAACSLSPIREGVLSIAGS